MTAKPPDEETRDEASPPPSRNWRKTLNRVLLGVGRADTAEDRARRWQRFREDVAEVASSLRPWT
ncbi:hypothetical protein MMAD_18830 [Mycolicibacterium madagascariense]|uniref:Uncharacterized protein n=1 Tax=Mycolicibacterium madagascariense TaxID=212765 RepID=A0A7I7XEL7_9MYCO|nr:hypothetical protein [Mycolicibacterium madagascariense]MCV7015294.1 hypothetical protein [Mycolicibacterium madagascariense]BBZ27588.1 hypothetical protein MMAD_18830 [Mycolicibacterium madagascariense]